MRQVGVGGVIIRILGGRNLLLTLASGLVLLVAAGVAIRTIGSVKRLISVIGGVLFIVSPLNVLAIWTILGASAYDVSTAIDRENEVVATREIRDAVPNRSIMVFLFDEASYEFLYSASRIRPEFPHFAQFSAVSSNYHNAHSPGIQTLESLPGYIMGKRFERIEVQSTSTREMNIVQSGIRERLETSRSENVFAIAKARGMETWLFGELLPYCEIWGQWLDECRSVSIYNYGGIERTFSVYNPLLTNIILWPRQPPTGVVKGMIYSKWGQRVVQEGYHYAERAIQRDRPIFMFMHLYLPHHPFVFNRDGYYRNWRPFEPSSETY